VTTWSADEGTAGLGPVLAGRPIPDGVDQHPAVRGIGVDLLARNRMTPALLGDDCAFVRKTYTASERREARGRDDAPSYLVGRFCAKEAVFKALAADPNRARLIDIEVLADGDGRPTVQLSGALAEHATARGIRDVLLSLTWESHHVLAFAVAVGDPSPTEEPCPPV
jgi:phosphopantetheine--protein transferase-like protein